MRIEAGTKLGGRVREGHWLGIDNESKGAQVYWPDSKTVNVERNIYFNSTSVNCREDENECVGLTKANLPIVHSQANPDPPVVHSQTNFETQINHNESAQESENDVSMKQARKPSQKVANLLGGKGTWSTNKSSSTLAPGIQKPTNDRMAVVEACEDKYAFATEVGNAEALEPQSLTEAK